MLPLHAVEVSMSEFEPVIQTRELGPGDLKEVQAHGRSVALTNIAQTYYAFDAECPVDGTNLARSGELEGELLRCPEDDAAFDLRTGECVEPDDGPNLQRYAIRVEDNAVKIGPPLD
jgi:nitrite reductase/ring-hydroxylating ferredoxin subunit